jgi:hypothetical protein
MPIVVDVPNRGRIELPDGTPETEIDSIVAKEFPPTGEDVASMMASDPSFVPSRDQFKLYKEFSKNKQVDWVNAAAEGFDHIVQLAGKAAAEGAQGAALNPLNLVEGFAQGTASLYGMLAQSENPSSVLFRFKELVSGKGSEEDQYQQFKEARQFNSYLNKLETGQENIVVPQELTNPEFVQGVALIADPTLFVPGFGQALGIEKVAAKAVGKAAQVTGRGVQAVARPVELAASAAERAVTGITGITPEALRGGLAASGVLAATGVAPAVGLVGAVPVVAAGAMDVGRAIETAGARLGQAPTRIGALEAVGAIPEANMRQRLIGTVGRYGGDAALNAALVGTTGSLEGAAVGGALGYLSGGEEGAAAGIGSGAAAGALGSLGARGLQTMTGQQAKAARLNDLTTYIDALPENKKAAYQSVQERFGTETASNLMDLETLIRGTRSDIGVEILTGKEFEKQAGVTARGIVPLENAPNPRILINVDAFSKGKGDTPIYTLGHELVHALASTKQFQGDITALTERLTGAYIPNPDGTMRLTAEGQYTPAKVEELFNQFVAKLPDDAKAKTINDNPTAADRASYVGEELAAEQVARILSAQKPDAFLRGFGTTRQSFTDMLMLQDASRAASRIGQYLERTFGVTPSDSIVFPQIKESSPMIDAALRQLLRARTNIDEALQRADFQKSFAVNSKNISDPTVAEYAIRGGFAERNQDGTVRLLTNGELLERERKDVSAARSIVNQVPGAKMDINGSLDAPLSPEQVNALNSSSVSSQMKERISMVNDSIKMGRSVLNEYYPATERKQDPESKRWRSKYAGRRMTFRETLFYNLLFSKEGNAYARGIDLSKIRSSLQKHIKDGGVAGVWPNVTAFMSDLAAYLTNRERGENAIPTRQLLGPEKAEFLGSFLNSFEQGGSEFIHAFRLDRFGKMDPGDFRARFGEIGYKGMKNRLMPAGTVGDAEAYKSQSGYTVLSKNNKFRLYGSDGKLIGIYDSSQQAEKKIYATEARIQPQDRQLQYQARNEGGQTPEAGGSNRIERGTEGGKESGQALGQVRQEGDVVIAPEAQSFTIPKADIGRFMPASDKVNIEDYADRKILALAADRMGIGQMSVGPKGAKRDLSVLGQGGRGFMNIFNGGGWAFSDFKTADKFLKRLRSEADPSGNVIVGITVQSPINHLKNQTGQLAYIEAMQAAIDSKTITKRAADAQVAAMSSAIVQSKAKSIKQSARDKFAEIKSFKDLKKAVTNKQLNFADMEPMLTQMQRKALPITHKELSDIGMTATDIARDLSDPELADVPFGSVVALLGVNVKQAPEKTGIHYSYPWTIHGDAIGYLNKFYNISDLSTEKRIRNAQGMVTAQPLQTVMPVMDNIINTIKTKQGIPSDPSMRFMPSDTDYLAAAKAGDTQTAQQMVDQAAKAAGYTVGPVYHGTADEFTAFDLNHPNRKDTGWLGTGVYLTSDPNLARSYSILKRGRSDPKTMTLYAKLSNPYKATLKDKQRIQLISNSKGSMEGREAADAWTRKLKDLGHDGVVLEFLAKDVGEKNASTEYVVFSPRDVKSADPITRDDAGKIIPLSQRFQKDSQDIRYMPSDTDYMSAVKSNDKQAAQQMVDQAAKAAGYTIKAYHGTTHGGFTEFNLPTENDPEYPVRGIFFSKDTSVPEEFTRRSAYDKETGKSPKVYSAYLKLEKPLVYREQLSSLSEKERQNVAEINKEDVESLEDYLEKRPNATIGNYLYQGGATDAEHLDGSVINYQYDGIIDGSVVVALDPSQIKSADPITYDDSGNVIPLSQRFQQTSEDIRYMPSLTPDPAVPGAFSASGGFRILPGKTGGRLRVYGPSGALVGIVGSQDEAQRLIRRKTKNN